MKRILLVFCLCVAATSVYAEDNWIADAKTGCKVLNSSSLPNPSITWSGGCKDGKANGKGTLTGYENGKMILIFEGVMEDGQCHRDCSLTTVDGTKYFGESKNNLRHGKGTLTYPDGAKYVGEFEKGWQHGIGTLTYPNGDTYSGGWYEGKQHGKGTYTFKDITSYEGLWEHGKRIKYSEAK